MNFTEDQQEFIDGVKDFIYKDFPRKSYISLQGPPGSGKSYTISKLKGLLPGKKIIYVAYTGKATDNLMKSGVEARTIYSVFYRVNPDTTELSFILKNKEEIPKYDLIVIDEVSMVSQKMFMELLSFGIKIVAVGDKNQLGPVKANKNTLLDNPDFELKTIHRQMETSGIIRLSHEWSEHHRFPAYGQYSEDVLIIPKSQVTAEMILSVNQTICGTNDTREKWNSYIRRAHGHYDYYPEPGERVICCKNTPIEVDFRRVINGTTGTITRIKVKGNNKLLLTFKPDWSEHDITLNADGTNFVNGNFNMNIPNVCCFDFAYVITVNKAQGSEWDNVLYIVDPEIPGKSFYDNVTTGITRAKKRLILAY